MISPFKDTIKGMESSRKKLFEESSNLMSQLNDSETLVKKAKNTLSIAEKDYEISLNSWKKFDNSANEKEREKIRTKLEKSEEKLNLARSSYRQCEEVSRALQQKIKNFEIPKLIEVNFTKNI